jgi:hypothetical protein
MKLPASLSCCNPGVTNTPLPIAINNYVASATVDLSFNKNVVHSRILSAETPLRRQYDRHVLLIGEGQNIKVERACDLYFATVDLPGKTSFLMSPNLGFVVALDSHYLYEYNVIHNDVLNCLYLGKDSKRWVFQVKTSVI